MKHFPAPRNPAQMEIFQFINGHHQYYIQINAFYLLRPKAFLYTKMNNRDVWDYLTTKECVRDPAKAFME